MTSAHAGAPPRLDGGEAAGRRFAAYFHELDAWTEYWDVYKPETRGRYYFGDGDGERGLLTRFLPREGSPPPWSAWIRMALSSRDAGGAEAAQAFADAVKDPPVREAVLEVDLLLGRLFATYFGAPEAPETQRDYLEAVFRFAVDALPAATERDARIPADDPRKSTAGRHTLEGDVMWFAWAMQVEAARAAAPGDGRTEARRALALAGVAVGCAGQFVWRGHRRTRPEYQADAATERLLFDRGLRWALDAPAAAEEVHALYRIREFGSDA